MNGYGFLNGGRQRSSWVNKMKPYNVMFQLEHEPTETELLVSGKRVKAWADEFCLGFQPAEPRPQRGGKQIIVGGER